MRTLNLVMGTISALLLIAIIGLIIFNITNGGIVETASFEF